jgi:WD40 repeat protein
MDIKQSHLALDWAYDRPLLAVRVAPDGLQAVTSAEDSTLQRWGLATGEKVVLKGHESWVHALRYSADGQQLVSGGCEGRLIWWSIAEAEPKPVRTIEAHAGWIRALDLSPDGTRLVSVGNDLVIRLWDMASGEKVAEWVGHEKHIYSVLFHPDGQHLLTGDLGGKLQMWNIASQQIAKSFDAKPLHTYEGGQRVDFGGVRGMALTTDGAQLLAGGLHKGTNPLGAVHEPLLLRFSTSDCTLLKSHVSDGIPGGVIWRVCTLPDNTSVAACGGSSGGFLLFFNAESEKDIHRFQLPALARDMDWHAATERVLTVHHDHHLRVTNLFAKSST